MRGKPWTVEEDEALKSYTLHQMRDHFGRSIWDTVNRRAQLGISFPRGKRPGVPGVRAYVPKEPKVDEKTAPLVQLLLEAGGDMSEAASRLGISDQAIHLRLGSTRRRVRLQRPIVSPDLTDRRFGLLKVLLDSGQDSDGQIVWLCRCKKHAALLVRTNDLVSETVVSCGCHQKSQEPLPEIVCAQCQQPFVPKNKGVRICSQECRRAAHCAAMKRQYDKRKAKSENPV